jgi:hypothetical protein
MVRLRTPSTKHRGCETGGATSRARPGISLTAPRMSWSRPELLGYHRTADAANLLAAQREWVTTGLVRSCGFVIRWSRVRVLPHKELASNHAETVNARPSGMKCGESAYRISEMRCSSSCLRRGNTFLRPSATTAFHSTDTVRTQRRQGQPRCSFAEAEKWERVGGRL